MAASFIPLQRGRVWLHRRDLDRELARGGDPHTNPALARRAEQLTSTRCRRSLAAGIERTLAAAEHPSRALTSAVPLQRREILAARAGLLALAAELGGTDEVQPRGVALVQRLLTDGDSPLYRLRRVGELERAVRHAKAALLLR